jgi:hypothetical protein
MWINKNTLCIGAAIFALLLDGAVALTSDRCKVTDPTGTPLNVRDPNMNIIGTIQNGRTVQFLQDGSDRDGKPWAYVGAPGGRPIGWVYREFISCY